MQAELRTNNNVVYRCAYHVVWCTKYRRDVITPEVGERFKVIAQEVCDERGAAIMEMETQPDHVHMLVSVDPQYGIHRLIKQVKGRSSRYLRQEFRHITRRIPTLWTNSYFVATVGGATLATVKQYIQEQNGV